MTYPTIDSILAAGTFYRKRPVVIEARVFDGTSDVAAWCHGYIEHYLTKDCLIIHTLEGNMAAEVGDYIIKGVFGEFYPCKPDIFADTYEEVQP